MPSDQPLDRRRKQRLVLALKIVVTFGLCTLIVWKSDWSNIGRALQQSDWGLMVLVFIGMLLNVTISAYKWQVLLSLHGIYLPFQRLHGYYFTSVFFNNFLPSNIGGDGYRIYKTWDNGSSKAGAVVAVVMERLTGIWALVVLGLAGTMAIYARQTTDIGWLKGVLIAFAGGAVAPLVFLLFSKRATHWLLNLSKLPSKFRSLLTLLDDYRRHKPKALGVIAISFGFHLFTFGWMQVLSFAVGAPTEWQYLAVALAICNLAAILPISINGIGVWDGSFIFAMAAMGMPQDSALLVMLTIRAFLIPISLIGGYLYMRDKRSPLKSDFDDPNSSLFKESLH